MNGFKTITVYIYNKVTCRLIYGICSTVGVISSSLNPVEEDPGPQDFSCLGFSGAHKSPCFGFSTIGVERSSAPGMFSSSEEGLFWFISRGSLSTTRRFKKC